MVDALCLLQAVERDTGMGMMPELLSTHPKLAERIKHLRELGGVDASHRCPDLPAQADPTLRPDGDEDDEPATCEPDH
jgi:hypothetical protein